MKKRLILMLISLLILGRSFLLDAAAPQPLRKINICLPSFSDNFAYLEIGKSLGFYAEEGLEVNVQALTGVVCGQSLSSKSMDFATSPDVLHLSLKDLPFRILFATGNRLAHYFIAGKGIGKFSDLEGKLVAIDAPGGWLDNNTRTVLRANGVSMAKVSFIAIGGPSDRTMALRAGSVQGGLIAPSEAIGLLEDGFRELPFQLVPDVSGLLGVKLQTINQDSGMIRAFVRASLKGHLLFGRRSEEVIPSVMKFTGIKDRAYMEKLIRIRKERNYNPDGVLNDQTMKEVISVTVKAFGLSERPASDVFDFQYVTQAFRELSAMNWNGLFK